MATRRLLTGCGQRASRTASSFDGGGYVSSADSLTRMWGLLGIRGKLPFQAPILCATVRQSPLLSNGQITIHELML